MTDDMKMKLTYYKERGTILTASFKAVSQIFFHFCPYKFCFITFSSLSNFILFFILFQNFDTTFIIFLHTQRVWRWGLVMIKLEHCVVEFINMNSDEKGGCKFLHLNLRVPLWLKRLPLQRSPQSCTCHERDAMRSPSDGGPSPVAIGKD